MNGVVLLGEEQGKWRATQELTFRKSKSLEDTMDRYLPCGVRLPGKDEGDGWVRFQITAPKTKFGFSIGDKVTWIHHDPDVPVGVVGTVVGMVDNPARIAVDFPTNPDG